MVSLSQGSLASTNLLSLRSLQALPELPALAFALAFTAVLALVFTAVLALVFLLAYVIRHAGTMSYTGITWLTVLMSGIFCNLFERMTLGYVRDYFYFKFVEFPIFNISDIAINVSIVAIIYLLLTRAQLKQL